MGAPFSARAAMRAMRRFRRARLSSARKRDDLARVELRPGSQARTRLKAASADPRSEAASASSATRRGEPRRKTSLTTREAPPPMTFRPSSPVAQAPPVRHRRAAAPASRPARPRPNGAASRGWSPARPRRAGLPRPAAQIERLIAQAMAFGEQQERARIDLVDADRGRRLSSRLRGRRRERTARRRSVIAVSLSPSGSVAITAPSSAPSLS